MPNSMTDQTDNGTPKAGLPTEYGWYLDRVDQAWRLNAGGWYCGSGWSSNSAAEWAPFTRLYTMRQAMGRAMNVVLDEGMVFDNEYDNALVGARLAEIGDGDWDAAF